jgi:hypothetical protein
LAQNASNASTLVWVRCINASSSVGIAVDSSGAAAFDTGAFARRGAAFLAVVFFGAAFFAGEAFFVALFFFDAPAFFVAAFFAGATFFVVATSFAGAAFFLVAGLSAGAPFFFAAVSFGDDFARALPAVVFGLAR